MTTHLGESTILEIGINYLDELCMIGYEMKIPLIQSMSEFLSGQNTYEQSKQTFLSVIGRTEPLDRLKEIVDMAEEPASEPNGSSSPPSTYIQGSSSNHYSSDTDPEMNGSANDPNSSPSSSACSESNPNGIRRKTRSWSPQEDTRLLAGIYKYGVDNWTTISSFIGNGRTRAQCCQRWTRGLNPRVSKNLWSYEEDLKLVQLVYLYGDKSWTKIASMMGNRSDVQCRYHYRQVMRDMPPLLKSPFNLPHSTNFDKSIPHEYEEIKSAIEGILPSRYSMPQFSNPHIDPSQQILKNSNIPSPSQNFISFAQNSTSNQVNFQTLPSFSATAVGMPIRSVLSLPSFDSDAAVFNVSNDPHTPAIPNTGSPKPYPRGNSQMQLVLNGGLDIKPMDKTTPPLRPSSNLSTPFQLPEQELLKPNNSSPIPSLSSFCSPSIYKVNNDNEAHPIPLQRRDSAPPNSKGQKIKFASPNELELELGCPKSFSGSSHLDNFLNDFR